jgi:pyruvyl transferase EpsO
MVFQEKINSLKTLLYKELTPLINGNYILLDLPYYHNIGDLLIWEGERYFLNELPYKCLYSASYRTYNFKYTMSKDAVILLQGGGNFGDIWRESQAFRLKIIERYPHNKIIIFPQTVYYENESVMRQDAEVMSSHSNLTICARDKHSYGLLKKYFKNHILLLPDMAFCIPPDRLQKHSTKEQNRILFLKRKDKELRDYKIVFPENIPVDISDWPTFEKRKWVNVSLYRLINIKKRLDSYNISTSGLGKVIDAYSSCIYRSALIKEGVRFVSNYKEIYTTRLHVAILSVLLYKHFYFLDNSYGKNRNFYDTWLKDLESIQFVY